VKCSACQTENPENRKFCRECGAKLILTCPGCNTENFPGDKFCGDCGNNLTISEPVTPQADETKADFESERKYVTVLFSDLSGYTSMTEKLDPEEVKEIMTLIFGEIAQVITKYEGFIERFVGDAVMAIFGVPKTHEDDPVRAVKSAIEIHKLVEQLSPKLKARTGVSLSMHSGINTGLVVTGEVKLDQGTHGLTGDVINTAARLQDLAKAGQILVGYETYRQSEGYFDYEELEPARLKGKEKAVVLYRMISPKDKPLTVHRLSGVRADLIGRKSEMARLQEAFENLKRGKRSIFSICGDAGTGKSRLVEEFKGGLPHGEVQILEGQAHAYTQNTSYFPLIDLFNDVFRIEETDAPEKLRDKIESGIGDLLGKTEHIVPFIGSLYSLKYPELSDVSPESWKRRIQEGVKAILSTLYRKMPTVLFLEDLHWADSSFLELLHKTLQEVHDPVLVLCAYRPPFNLFTSHQLGTLPGEYHEMRLQDFSPSDAEAMVCSLLKTNSLPPDLSRFVQNKAEGNPFYLEEVINSLIESKSLVQDDGNWRMAGRIGDLEISSSIRGVILARLDRLEKESKRVLQEASVIGRAFLYDIVNLVTDKKDQIARCLSSLEQLDLIRTKSLQPDLEYVFKHVMTQEVVYNGLLKKERQEIHERIGLAIEQLFHDRIHEFCETLALHFIQGQSRIKAVGYLMMSGEKSLGRYALEESHQYFKQAFDLLAGDTAKTKKEEKMLIDLLIRWAFVFYYRGDYIGMTTLLTKYKGLAESLGDRASLGMFYAWLGGALFSREELKEAYQYLKEALEIGEQLKNHRVMCYAFNWLIWTCTELGLLDEAIDFGKRSQDMARLHDLEQFLHWNTLAAIGHASFYSGDAKKTFEVGKDLLDYGEKRSNIRGMVLGNCMIGCSHFMTGDFISAIEYYKISVQLSADPYYMHWPLMLLCFSYVSNGQFQEAEDGITEVLTYSQNFGAEIIGTPAQSILGIVFVSKGQLNRGIKILEDGQRSYMEKGRRWCYALSEYILGSIYLQMFKGGGPRSFSLLCKNMAFLVRNMPIAGKKAEAHLNRAILAAREIGARGTLGISYLNLGLLHKAKRRNDLAKKCLADAIQVLETCMPDGYLKQAKEALRSLG
jgi:class 3 adenylate cyclase/tetratricopeptide (TPR) repeat protein